MINFIAKLRILIIPLACIFLIGWIDPASDKNEEGLQLYNEQAYDEAISKFADAQLHVPKSDSLGFNIANTHYKGGKLPEAEKAYKGALGSKDDTLKAKANYNMGNTLFKQGKLNESLDFYKKAIELAETPVIAAVNGTAFGFGLEILHKHCQSSRIIGVVSSRMFLFPISFWSNH